MSDKFMPSAEEVDRQIVDEFLDDARDMATTMELALQRSRSQSASAAESLAEIKRTAHNLKSQTRLVDSAGSGHGQVSAQLSLVKIVAHRLFDYVLDLESLTGRPVDDIQAFIDKINAILDGDISIDTAEEAPKVARELPRKITFDVDFGDIEQKDIMVLTIIPEKAMGHVVEKELAACGFNASNVRSPFEAFEQVVRVHPDLIIASMELGDLSGVDLASAFSAMPKTRDIPFALLTSYQFNHAALKDLPPRAAVLQKGKGFGDDLAVALSRFGIT